MFGVNKKPLKTAFWLMLAAVLMHAAQLVMVWVHESPIVVPNLIFSAGVGLLKVLLCIHMKFQQSCKTDVLFPVAFAGRISFGLAALAIDIVGLITYYYSYTNIMEKLVFDILCIVPNAMILLDYFRIKRAIVSLAAIIGMIILELRSLYDTIKFLLSSWLMFPFFWFYLLEILNVVLTLTACGIYMLIRMKYQKLLKHSSYQEKEQMLRMLKLQYESGKFSERQYRRRKREVLKFM